MISYLLSKSRKQRIIGFMTCILLGSFFMGVASLYIPILLLKSRKFVMLFSIGSVFFLARFVGSILRIWIILFLKSFNCSFSLLWGVKSHMKHLFSVTRLPFTLSYLFTLFGTIYVSVMLKSVILTLIFAILQVVTLVW